MGKERLSKGSRTFIRRNLGESRREIEDQTIRDDRGYAVEKLTRMFEMGPEESMAIAKYWEIRKERLDGLLDNDEYKLRLHELNARMKEVDNSRAMWSGVRFLDSIFSKKY